MTIRSTLVGVPAYNTRLLGDLSVPDVPRGLALVAHTSGTDRWDPRERRLVAALRTHHLAALRLDLLTSDESALNAMTRRPHVDIALLAKRLVAAMDWAVRQAQFATVPMGFVGTGLGAAAVLAAAASRPHAMYAVVLVDGRPDAVTGPVDGIHAPTLLIAGRDNTEIVAMNEHVLTRLRCQKRLELLDGVSNVLEQQHSLDDAARLTAEWFGRFLGPAGGQMNDPANQTEDAGGSEKN
jgi:putative phosphoribosyl transferase